jgi:hypothetical protein
MTKGLKQMVAEAIEEVTKPEPVTVSDEALRALSTKMRQWSGWSDSHIVFGDPSKYGSPFAACDHTTHRFTANADRLVLNPNRVLLTVTPFRLRQEAVLTGALLHEAGHARHSKWLPRDAETAAAKPLLHSDGTVPTRQTVALARLMEEPRVEGLQALHAANIGAAGLGWTMRASAAHLLPTTTLSADPDQKIMDLITSWALRAGRQIALAHWTNLSPRQWVQDFTSLLHVTITAHLAASTDADGTEGIVASNIITRLREMAVVTDDTGPTMINMAREVLELLFPETDSDEQPMPGEGCTSGAPEDSDESESEAGEGGEGDESGSEGEGNTEPEDEGEGTDPGAGDAGPDEAEQEEEDEDEGASPSTESDDDTEAEQEPDDTESTDTESDLAKALADMEAESKDQTVDEAGGEGDIDPDEEADSASGAGMGGFGDMGGGWRRPKKDEREIAKGAERFLRDLIAPSEALKRTLDDAPSAMVDGAAMAAWKAGGQRTAPRFFVRSRRSVEPSPPVRVAILVDVSGSMEELQAPSAVLSWALASAALDLRNFAGRGQQIESCLIHWGSDARVIQRNGQMLPGIKEFNCIEGTNAMHEALGLVEEEMPGFFDITETPTNRLLVQFTDWELSGYTRYPSTPIIARALEAGVNMLTVAPHDYSERRACLPEILAECKVQRGSSSLLRYDKRFPGQVWDNAAKALA